MKKDRWTAWLIGIACALLGTTPAWADDFKDGISEFTEEAVEAGDQLGDQDININFIIADALAKAKAVKQRALEATSNSLRSQISGGQDDSNENSIVIEPGSKIGTVINIVEKK